MNVQPVLDNMTETTTAAESAQLTLTSIITQGGGLMYVLVFLSLVAVCLIIFYLLTMRSSVICPKDFLRKAQDAADAGDVDALAELAASENTPLAKILSGACEVLQEEGADQAALQKAMEEEGSRQMSRLWSRIQYLTDLGTIAPMVGLLGTVWGMMVSFTGLESGLNIINKADRLADGVSQAMFTTFGGLIIGIVTIGAYALFRGHLNRLSADLESSCAALLRRIVRASAAKNDK